MMAHQEKIYEHKPLPAGPSIRLIKTSSAIESPITCSLKSFKISEAPCYHALSYTWGDPLDQRLSSPSNYRVVTNQLDRHVVDEDGSIIKVTENLLDALKELGARPANDSHSIENEPYWWIDAICINQEDVEEKNAQVAMMGRIFEKAERVVIWLGKEDEHTDGALKVLRGLAGPKADSRKSLVSQHNWSSDGHAAGGELMKASGFLGLHDINYQDWLDYAAFLQRKWFSRTWVIQEKFFAADTETRCGKRSIPWAEISKSSELLIHTQMNILLKAYVDYTLSGATYNVSTAVGQLPNTRLDNPQIFSILRRENVQNIRLDELLYWTKTFDATDQKDHIYGIRDIWEDCRRVSGARLSIRTDYRRETSEVYSEATMLAICESQRLDILGLAEDPISRERQDLATWIPDYSSGPMMYPLVLTLSQSVTPPTWCASRSLKFVAPETVDGNELAVDGVEYDEIVQVGPSYVEIMNHFQLGSLLQLLANYPHKRYPSNDSCCDAFSRTLIKNTFRGQPASQQACEAFSGFLMKRIQEFEEHISNLIGRRRMNEARAFSECLGNLKQALDDLAFRFQGQNVVPSALEIARLISIAEDEGSTDEQVLEDQRKGMEESFRIAYLGRRIFATKRGFFGITSESVKKGDTVWILAGAGTPFVLRKTSQRKLRVVGEGYITGLMQGEAVVGGVATERIFLV